MIDRYPLGGVARLAFDIINNNAGVTAQLPVIVIQRVADGKWFQASDDTWQATPVENDMVEADALNLPGHYYFDFDQALDTLEQSKSYLVKLRNPGGTARLEYRSIEFGGMPNAADLQLCSVLGSVVDLGAKREPNVKVEAQLYPVMLEGAGRAVRNDVLVHTYTDANGEFELPLVRGATCRLIIEAIGYDRKVVIPDQASVEFTDL